MPVITVEGPPKSIEVKRKAVELITKAFKEAYGYPEKFTNVIVIINENQPENIGNNGKLIADLFKKDKEK
jgi:4-oxalocrotonate tautomerase